MNKNYYQVLLYLSKNAYTNQRTISAACNFSLGLTNTIIKQLCQQEYLDHRFSLTKKAYHLLNQKKTKRAVILAAGIGMRMVPIHTECPKALLTIKGETLIERQISQLHAVDITDIVVVVGHLKEQFEFLIDKYNIRLVYNPEYATKNNIYSLFLVKDYIQDCYIIPCDLWCENNPFSSNEFYSWYMVTDEISSTSLIRINRKQRLIKTSTNELGNTMFGICYLDSVDGTIAAQNLDALCHNPQYFNSFWEEALFQPEKIPVYAKVVSAKNHIEINTYEQLRDINNDSLQLQSNIFSLITQELKCNLTDIVDITLQKKGMTNRSFLFSVNNIRYIMRIPGEGTDHLINRANEAAVYNCIHSKNICDEILYVNPDNGYKITRLIENARVCNAEDPEDVKKCMDFLRSFHNMELTVNHEFDIFERINYYESLWLSNQSQFVDYKETKAHIFSLKSFIDAHKSPYCLTHIDAVADNFLIFNNQQGEEELRLIDWEYASMQDPHVDIAMFAIYSGYDRQQVDSLIDTYFGTICSQETRIKIYAYISACGLLWSNWCEYKRDLGIVFGEYSLQQYRYAKQYYWIVAKYLCQEVSNV